MICTESIGTNFFVQKMGHTIFESIDRKFYIFIEAVELIQYTFYFQLAD